MTTMKILSPGPLSTVQDAGRFGYMSTGFSPSGAMDTYSMKIANILVGNRPEEGVIEMTMMGMTVTFDMISETELLIYSIFVIKAKNSFSSPKSIF